MLERTLLSDQELGAAVAAVVRIRAKAVRGSDNEFIFLRPGSNEDHLTLFSLLNRYIPFLTAVMGPLQIPGIDRSPYQQHNSLQIAIKPAGSVGIASLENMADPALGQIDPSHNHQREGCPCANYTCLIGICLQGKTMRRDAGNLYVSKGSHKILERAFADMEGHIEWSSSILHKYDVGTVASMTPVLLQPGQAVLLQYQTLQCVGPNLTDVDRIHIYFRLTSTGRPLGCHLHYPPALRDVTLEMPGLVRAVSSDPAPRPAKRRNRSDCE